MFDKPTKYKFQTSEEFFPAMYNLIRFVGGSVHTVVIHNSLFDENIHKYDIYCLLTWAQMRRLKRRLKYGKNRFISVSCYKRTQNASYKRSWYRYVPHYTLPSIRKIKPDFGYEVQ